VAGHEHKSQKTEQPTARRLKKARDKGQVARSKEVPAVLNLVAFLVFAHFAGPRWLDRLQEFMIAFFSAPGPDDFNPDSVRDLLESAVVSTGSLLALPLGMLVSAGLVGNLIQGPPAFTFEPLKPTWDRLNPVKGIKKVVALKQWIEVIKGVLKMTLYAAVAYSAVLDVLVNNRASSPGIEGVLSTLFTLAGTVILRVSVVAGALAILDWLFRIYDHQRGLKMSKREIKDEHKETQGDPVIRARIRQKQMALARSRMMADVANATIVITNPTHYAVALRYAPGELSAPQLLAKGRAKVAARIREIAQQHGIPIVSDPPLARMLYKDVPIGTEIPFALFRAVAEVLALVLHRKGAPRGNDGPGATP